MYLYHAPLRKQNWNSHDQSDGWQRNAMAAASSRRMKNSNVGLKKTGRTHRDCLKDTFMTPIPVLCICPCHDGLSTSCHQWPTSEPGSQTSISFLHFAVLSCVDSIPFCYALLLTAGLTFGADDYALVLVVASCSFFTTYTLLGMTLAYCHHRRPPPLRNEPCCVSFHR